MIGYESYTKMNFLGKQFINQELEALWKDSAGYESYYDAFKTKDHLKLLDTKIINNEPLIRFKYRYIVKKITREGTISPQGPIISTPVKIKVPLKIHQQRTLYEMKIRENSQYRYTDELNINLLCDNVGSGKSLCILSLIADSPIAKFKTDKYYSSWPTGMYSNPSIPYSSNSFTRKSQYLYGRKYELYNTIAHGESSIELKINLIIVPHNVFNQWKQYIQNHTNLNAIFIAGKKNYTELCESKSKILKACNEHEILLVKSTMYKKLIDNLNDHLGYTELVRKFNESNIVDESSDLRSQILKLNETFNANTAKFLKLIDTHTSNEEEVANVKQLLNNNLKNYKSFIENKKWANILQNRCKRTTHNKSYIDGYYFQRVIIDEADSIKVSAFPYSYSKQTWFISSSINNLLYPTGYSPWNSETRQYKLVSTGISGTGFIKNSLTRMFEATSGYRSKLQDYRGLYSLVCNNPKFVEYSINIPPANIHYIPCYTPPHISAIKNAISKDALKAFNAGDTDKAIELLGCSGSSEENIVENLTLKFHKEIKELQDKITEKNGEISDHLIQNQNVENLLQTAIQQQENTDSLETAIIISTLQTQKDENKRLVTNIKNVIKNAEKKIKDLQTKIEGISNRIKDSSSKQCPICYCEFSNPCITPCCNNVFCLECITMALDSSSKKECPLCRKNINIQDVSLIINSDSVSEVKKDKLPTKLERLLSIIKSNPDKRFMVFSEFNSSLEQIQNEFKTNKIEYSFIKGHSSTISRILTNFEKKTFNVLLLNATHFGAGLNLQFTDEIIIWHRMSEDLEKQVIGRAQRLGREKELEISYLCYDNEYENVN